MKYQRIVFWQNMLSMHQSPYIRALAARGYEVIWVTDERFEGTERQKMGWVPPDLGSARLIEAPNDAEIATLVHENLDDSFHFLSGVFGVPTVRAATQHLRRLPSHCGLISERPKFVALGQTAKPHHKLKRALGERLFRFQMGGRVRAVLGISRLSCDWFHSCGYPEKMVFPWAYCPEVVGEIAPVERNESVRILYLGTLAPWKGPDLLIHALGRVSGEWSATLIGAGPMQAECEALVAAHPHRERITLTPYLAYAEAMDALRHYDLLVIPSRHDGWGAVVNEALQRGVPVIATDEVGAHDLLGAPWRGTIVPSDDVHALGAALQARIDAGPLTKDDRLRILEWSSVISGEAFTDYLEAILAYARTGGTRPSAPWLTDGSGLPTAR